MQSISSAICVLWCTADVPAASAQQAVDQLQDLNDSVSQAAAGKAAEQGCAQLSLALCAAGLLALFCITIHSWHCTSTSLPYLGLAGSSNISKCEQNEVVSGILAAKNKPVGFNTMS